MPETSRLIIVDERTGCYVINEAYRPIIASFVGRNWDTEFIEMRGKGMAGAQKIGELKNKIIEHIENLIKWNNDHLKQEPEQCRKNLETIVSCFQQLTIIR